MAGTVKPIPEGYPPVIPYLTIGNIAEVIEFLKRTFDAQVSYVMELPNGSIGHAEVRIGESVIMLGAASDEWKAMPSNFYMYVEDVDARYQRALEAGATVVMEPTDQFYGDRHGGVKDAAGNTWWIATHIEDVSSEELERRAAAARS